MIFDFSVNFSLAVYANMVQLLVALNLLNDLFSSTIKGLKWISAAKWISKTWETDTCRVVPVVPQESVTNKIRP